MMEWELAAEMLKYNICRKDGEVRWYEVVPVPVPVPVVSGAGHEALFIEPGRKVAG